MNKERAPRKAEQEELLEGFIFVRTLCGTIYEDFTEVLEEYCDKNGLETDRFIHNMLDKMAEHDGGRPLNFPFSKEFEKEFVGYIEKCKKVFPLLKEMGDL